jgi:hypothetical protein
MNNSAGNSAHVAILDAMIGRAEAACERYRRAVTEKGLHPQAARSRGKALQLMELSLSRLRAQRTVDHASG